MFNDLLEEILSCTHLPSLPAVAVQLLDLTSDPDVAMSDIAKLVQQDQALSAKVLKTVNSSFYGLSTPCGSIERAMGYLGLNTVKSLVLGFSLIETTSGAGDDGFDLNSHWRRAIIGATGSRTVARLVGGVDPEEGFTAALFQDMGMLASFAFLKEKYTDVIGGIDHRVLSKTETDEFGLDHALVGSELAKKWKLPDQIANAIAHHHNIEHVDKTHTELAKVVALGAVISDAMDEGLAKTAIRKLERLTQSWYGKKAPDIGSLLEEVSETSRVLAKMFEQEIGELPTSSDLIARAQDQSIEHQVSIQRHSEELERSAYLDGLTGIANRKRFDIELGSTFTDFKENNTGFGMLFFDADKFKNVNDTHGHAAGDAVLIELAKRTSDAIGDSGLVCRYGGEEFAVILFDSNLDQAAKLGEHVRSTIAQSPFDLRAVDGAPDELVVTVSVGVSTTCAGGPERLSNADMLVQEADECVYAAKADGRNNVKVFGRLAHSESSDTESAPETVVKVDSPLSISPAAQRNAPERVTPKVETIQSVSKRPGRILLVEDDALAATLVISLIRRRDKDIEVQWVKSGTKACVLLQEDSFARDGAVDLILCDLDLPGCNGHEVLRVVKSIDSVAKIPFYMLTGSKDTDMRDESRRLGASKYILKDEFCSNVAKWVGEVLQPLSLAA